MRNSRLSSSSLTLLSSFGASFSTTVFARRTLDKRHSSVNGVRLVSTHSTQPETQPHKACRSERVFCVCMSNMMTCMMRVCVCLGGTGVWRDKKSIIVQAQTMTFDLCTRTQHIYDTYTKAHDRRTCSAHGCTKLVRCRVCVVRLCLVAVVVVVVVLFLWVFG